MVVSTNMHSHMHLSKCIENYGPIQVFWLFSFEHYNGILGSYHTNQRAIEIQVMRKFCRDMTIKTLAYSEPAVEMHKQLFCTVLDDKVTGRKIQQWQYLYFQHHNYEKEYSSKTSLLQNARLDLQTGHITSDSFLLRCH